MSIAVKEIVENVNSHYSDDTDDNGRAHLRVD